MRGKSAIKLLIKVCLLALPLMLATIFYFCADPFKVIWKYDHYYQSGVANPVTLDRDYVSTQTFIRECKKKDFDSFIFGSSRSLFYQVKDWQPWIHNGTCFHFDASGETIYGIHRKIRYLDRNRATIRNALVILDYETLRFVADTDSHLNIKHPALSGRSWMAFHWVFFKAFLDPKFFCAYVDFKVRGSVRPYMRKDLLIDDRVMGFDPDTNELSLPAVEQMIATNSAGYYQAHAEAFPPRAPNPPPCPAVIGPEQKAMLQDIRRIFAADHTEYRIIISPVYDQRRLNEADLEYLKTLFGKEFVYDFSGVNAITEDRENYYENSHYRPHVARQILKSVYSNTTAWTVR